MEFENFMLLSSCGAYVSSSLVPISLSWHFLFFFNYFYFSPIRLCMDATFENVKPCKMSIP